MSWPTNERAQSSAAFAALAVLVIARALDPAVVQSLRLHRFDFLEELAPRKAWPDTVLICATCTLASFAAELETARTVKMKDDTAGDAPSSSHGIHLASFTESWHDLACRLSPRGSRSEPWQPQLEADNLFPDAIPTDCTSRLRRDAPS
jgi:hypothetical protein